MKELDNIVFNIKETANKDNGRKYHIEIKVPMSIGFIERMKFIVENDKFRDAKQLHHVENKDGFVIFDGDIELDSNDTFYYYFSFEINYIHFFHI